MAAARAFCLAFEYASRRSPSLMLSHVFWYTAICASRFVEYACAILSMLSGVNLYFIPFSVNSPL